MVPQPDPVQGQLVGPLTVGEKVLLAGIVAAILATIVGAAMLLRAVVEASANTLG